MSKMMIDVEIKEKGKDTILVFDEIVLSKNQFEYHKSIIGKQNDFITNFIGNNLDDIKIL